MKTKNCLILMMMLLWGMVAQAQSKKETPEEKKARMERIENAKIAFITEKLSMNQDQAQRFWPVYNEHEAKRQELRQRMRPYKEENISALSEEKVLAGLEARMAIRQRELDLEKEYMDRYLRVISAKQLALLYRSEREFTKLLLERLQTAKK
ncbi:hypothetical protein [Rufibacter sp. LB8]|uniref:hypothetical protein n=1 Tax=Rufibacter sp. LB8 TaxID=2777781 RepID=UPI001CEF78F1|nr:hypothetical protein [Rufibacter sp. LB8]